MSETKVPSDLKCNDIEMTKYNIDTNRIYEKFKPMMVYTLKYTNENIISKMQPEIKKYFGESMANYLLNVPILF